MSVNTETKVGTFVIVCLALLGITIYYVGNEQFGRHAIPYRTYLRYAGGVGPGTEVLFGGIEVGRVTAVRSWNQDPTKIEVLLEVKSGTPVNEKSVAGLGAVSLMASPSISITTGTMEAHQLKAGQVIASRETISIDDMTRKLSSIADSVTDVVAQLQGELKDVVGPAQTVLANLSDATGPANRRQVAEILARVNGLIAQESPKIDRIADQVLQVSQDADAAIGKAGPLLDNAGTTVANVNSTIDQLRDPLKQDLAELRSTMEQARGLLASIQTVVQANDDNLHQSIDNLRVATENLDSLTDQVKQRPWSLVRIRQPKDRKVPQ
ncbi:MAG: MCE family protein [Acidobacteriia bacterium]|nr:MCE family protein [Terriglobia bacterium]MBV8904423.1 MCE family protein [Terriglobia bacterium]